MYTSCNLWLLADSPETGEFPMPFVDTRKLKVIERLPGW